MGSSVGYLITQINMFIWEVAFKSAIYPGGVSSLTVSHNNRIYCHFDLLFLGTFTAGI